jgi:hypothetical protein
MQRRQLVPAESVWLPNPGLSVWLWNVTIHLTGGLPTRSSKDLDKAKAEF